MKKIFVLIIFIFCANFQAQVKWMSLNTALEAQKEHPKKILIDFYADWCGPCKIMDKQTYGNPVIAEEINTNYYPVKFDTDTKESITIFGKTFINTDIQKGKKRNAMHDFPKYMNVYAIPSIVFLDEKSNPITVLSGLLLAKELEPYLTMISKDDYKRIKTKAEWDDYQRKFKSKLK